MVSFVSDFFSTLGLAGISSILSAVLVFIICAIVIKIVMALADKLLSRSGKLDGALKGFLRTALHIALWVLAGVMIAGSLGINTASLVAVVSIVGLALSLSVQNILGNLFSGITLLITRPFVQNDLVEISGMTGTVKSVGLFYTVINTLDNRYISIPNSDVTSASVINYSREPLRRVDMTFSASYDDSTEAVRGAIKEAVDADSRIVSDPQPLIVLSSFGESSIEYTVRVWCHNADYWDVYFGLNESVRASFEKNGVSMTYAHMNVHIVEK